MNPYPGAPGYYPGPPPAAAPSPVPRTLGTLSLVFASLSIAGSVIGLLSAGLMSSLSQGSGLSDSRMGDAMARYMEAIRPITTVNTLIFVILSAALLFIGIGQRNHRAWARVWSIRWGIAALVALAVVLTLHFTFVSPALAEYARDLAGGGTNMPMTGAFAQVTSLVSFALYVPFPIILIVSYRKPHIAASMTR